MTLTDEECKPATGARHINRPYQQGEGGDSRNFESQA